MAAPGVPDPLTDPATLARAVTLGILDAPQLRNNPFAHGVRLLPTHYRMRRIVTVASAANSRMEQALV